MTEPLPGTLAAQFGFADGSVHFLQEDMDLTAYQYLGDRMDGQTLDGLW